jgi:hypothetical protein
MIKIWEAMEFKGVRHNLILLTGSRFKNLIELIISLRSQNKTTISKITIIQIIYSRIITQLQTILIPIIQ